MLLGLVATWSEKLAKSMGQPVIVENKPGAATIIGTQHVVSAPADGYTILCTVALARRITRNAPLAVRESLRIARLAVDLDDAELRALSTASRERIQATEDYQGGPRAFVEKREPRWMGR